MHTPPSSSAADTPLAAQQQHAALVAIAGGAAPPGQQWQQQPPPEIHIQSPWRRSACDRCRSQKLRCVRAKEDDTSWPCTRCLRIRYPCFTSAAKPPGRDSNRLPPSPSANPPARRKATRRRASEDVSLALSRNSAMSMEWSFTQDEDQNEEAEIFEDGGMLVLTPSDEYQPIDLFEFPADKNPPGPECVTGLAPLLPFTSTSPPSGLNFLLELDKEIEGAVDMTSEDQSLMPSQRPTPSFQCSPCVLLTRLLESLSVQLVRLNTEPWDLGVLSVTGSTTDSGEIDVITAEALTNEAPIFNPLLSILVSTGKFVDICNLFITPESSGGAVEASTATTVAAGSASHSGPERRFSFMHETGENRRTQGTAKRAGQPSITSSLPFPSSHPCSTRITSSSSSPGRTESCTSFPSLLVPPTGQRVITAAQMLMMVSCYLQVVTIYDNIFSHLLFQLALPPPQPSPSTQHPATMDPTITGSNRPTSRQRHSHHTQQVQLATHDGRPMVPSLVLAGYSVPLNASLRMRLLVEVVEHQFEQIEHALGLPSQYCVSTSHQHKDIGSGLLGGREATTLLEAVIGLSIGIESGGENAGRDSIGVVASLRETLGKAKRVRRGGG
ncbi:hypothetical protein F4680DRAFT_432651 [Xylaria scruposa]|nr:hypothetical protein F4680DRAFT_432651 [Xylaria scruposa]